MQRRIHEAPEKAACVVIPEIPAGSVVLFSEAVMHGTAPWRADERRTLLYYVRSITRRRRTWRGAIGPVTNEHEWLADVEAANPLRLPSPLRPQLTTGHWTI